MSDIKERNEQRQKTPAKQKMSWTYDHDMLLCREVLVEEPYKMKLGSRERGQCWEKIASSCNQIAKPRFIVDQRAVREHFTKLIRDHRRKIAAEERASGISPEHTELDDAMEDIMERMKEAEEELARGEEKKEKSAEIENETAESVRKRSMERLSQTRERESDQEGASGKKRKRRGSGDTIEYLKDKNDKDISIKKEEIELKRQELALRQKEAERQWELKQREQDLKEKEIELRKGEEATRNKEKNDLIAILQQQNKLLVGLIEQAQKKN